MTKTVSVLEKSQRAGDGESPVRVGKQRISLLSSSDKSILRVVLTGIPPLWGTISLPFGKYVVTGG